MVAIEDYGKTEAKIKKNTTEQYGKSSLGNEVSGVCARAQSKP